MSNYSFEVKYDEWDDRGRDIKITASRSNQSFSLPAINKEELLSLKSEIEKFLNK